MFLRLHAAPFSGVIISLRSDLINLFFALKNQQMPNNQNRSDGSFEPSPLSTAVQCSNQTMDYPQTSVQSKMVRDIHGYWKASEVFQECKLQ